MLRGRGKARAWFAVASLLTGAGILTGTTVLGAGAATAAATTGTVTVTVTVTAADTGQPIAHVCGQLNSALSSHPSQGGTCAGVDGVLTWTSVPAGTWYAQVFDGSQLYTAARTPDLMLTDTGPGVETSLTLTKGGVITGTAVDRATGKPVQEVCPTAFSGRTEAAVGFGTCSGTDGVWTITSLPTAKVTVRLSGDGAIDGHSDRWTLDADTQATATLYTVTAGATTTVGAVRMDHGAILRGRIADRSGRPVAEATVVVDGYDANGGSRWNAVTDTTGSYEITHVSAGRHILLVTTFGQPYAWQWSGRATDPARAPDLTFRNDRTTRFDAVLAPEAPLTVTVTDARLRYSSVQAFASSGAPVGFQGAASPGSPAKIAGLPASTVRIRVTFLDGTVIWYPNATSFTTATPVRVHPDHTTSVTVIAP